MRGLLAVSGQRGLSLGSLLIAVGGLTLYQMTSLVLGPAGSRELHLSLAIPAVDADDVLEVATPSGSRALGMVVAITPAPSPTALRQALRQPAQLRPTAVPAAAPVLATRRRCPSHRYRRQSTGTDIHNRPGSTTPTNYHDPDERGI